MFQRSQQSLLLLNALMAIGKEFLQWSALHFALQWHLSLKTNLLSLCLLSRGTDIHADHIWAWAPIAISVQQHLNLVHNQRLPTWQLSWRPYFDNFKALLRYSCRCTLLPASVNRRYPCCLKGFIVLSLCALSLNFWIKAKFELAFEFPGVPLFLANAAITSWIKFDFNQTPAIMVVILHGLAVLYLLLAHARWFKHLFSVAQNEALQVCYRAPISPFA